MANFQMILGVILIAGSLLASTAEIPKPSYTRTMLKVSRSLPGETEELKVRTSEGNVATLIVKRREKSANDEEKNLSQVSKEPEEAADAFAEKNENISSTLSKNSETVVQDRKDEVRRSENQQIEEIREKTSSGNFTSKNDEPEVTITSSNRSTGSEVNLPEVTTQSSSVNERLIDYGNWTPLSKDGRALETNESKDNEYSSWKPLRASPEIIPNDRTNFARYQIPINRQDGLIFARNFHDRETKNYEQDGTSRGRIIANQPIAFLPHQARPLTRTNIGANLSKNRGGKNVPPEVTVRSEINVKSLPNRTPMSMDADGTPVIHGTRVPDEPMDKIQTWRNARVINNKLISDAANTVTMESSNGFYGTENTAERQRFERFFKDVNRRYGRNFGDDRNVYFEWDPKTHQNSALNAEIYETRNENYRSNIQKRMLHPDSMQIYPNSQMYTPESQKMISPLALKPGARTPVLQYAHPELGVQPAKILKNTEKRRPENFPDNQNSFTEQRHKKKYVLNDKNVVDSYTLKNYYPNQHFYGLKRPNDQPFWVKISENLRNQFSTGVERVSQLTRPVFDPLVEATHKISQNLGLSRGNEAQDKIGTVATGGSILFPALGLVASGAALGIGAVAVGRYLDVNMLKRGRNEENEGSIDDELELENSRALEGIETPWTLGESENWKNNGGSSEASRQSRSYEYGPKNSYVLRENPAVISRPREIQKNDEISPREDQDGVFMILEETEDNERVENRQTKPVIDESGYVETRGRRKRNVDNGDLFVIDGARNKRLRRTGPDSLAEIVEIDVPIKGKIDLPEILRKIVDKDGDRLVLVKDDLETNSLVENGISSQDNDGRDDLLRIGMIAEEEILNGHEEIKSRRRDRRDTDRELDDALQNLENAEISEVAHIAGDWTNTPCAKRIFCDAMIQRGQDASMFMEKKMDALLGLIQPGAALQVSSHFQEVMEAVRRHDCSSFLCPQARPGNVFF